METFAVYLGKSAAWLTGFALVYHLFLRKERYFTLKRIYLITGIVASVIFPLISFHYFIEVPAVSAFVPEGFNPDLPEGTSQAPQVLTHEPFRFSYNMILMLLYLSGMVFFASRIIKQAKELFNKINKAKVSDLGYAKLVRASEFPTSFSFFNYVFINPSLSEIEMEPIMKHELVHIKQKHWLDLILVEILCLLQWVNPFIWIYSRFVRLNHEYIADQVALQSSTDPSLYRAVLLNQMFSSPVISLSNSFNYSINKTRFEMMKKMIISPWRRLKVLIVLPVFAIVFYAFATPEYRYVNQETNDFEPLAIYQSPVIVQNQLDPRKHEIDQRQVKGVVMTVDGKPLENVAISSVTSSGNKFHVMTKIDGRFLIEKQDDTPLLFFSVGYMRLILNPDFSSEMIVKLKRDPSYNQVEVSFQPSDAIVVIDGELTEMKPAEARKQLGYNFGIAKFIRGKEATDKYGDKAINGVYEIITRKKALEMGLKPSFPRLAPGDYPTFQNRVHGEFRDWVLDHLKYPEEALIGKIEGWIAINFQVELDGTVNKMEPSGSADPVLINEVIRVINSSPRWEPPKNPNVDEPYRSTVMIRFRLPDQISREDPPFVVVEEMPMYPGGPEALLSYVQENLEYPEQAKKDSVQGRVIVRFIVNTEGNTEGISVLKGVDPKLDNEAIRVVSTIKGFKPGKQGGKPVPVWYMIPITFTLK